MRRLHYTLGLEEPNMSDRAQPERAWEEVDVALVRPESYVLTIRLNASESKELTAEARIAGQKLGTFIKSAALETIARHRAARAAEASSANAGGVGFSTAMLDAAAQLGTLSFNKIVGAEPATHPQMNSHVEVRWADGVPSGSGSENRS